MDFRDFPPCPGMLVMRSEPAHKTMPPLIGELEQGRVYRIRRLSVADYDPVTQSRTSTITAAHLFEVMLPDSDGVPTAFNLANFIPYKMKVRQRRAR